MGKPDKLASEKPVLEIKKKNKLFHEDMLP